MRVYHTHGPPATAHVSVPNRRNTYVEGLNSEVKKLPLAHKPNKCFRVRKNGSKGSTERF